MIQKENNPNKHFGITFEKLLPLILSLFWLHFSVKVAEVTGFHTEIKREGRKLQWILQGLLQIDGMC